LRPSPIPVIPEDDIEMVDRPVGDPVDQEDSSSDATLVDLEPTVSTDSAVDNVTKSYEKSADAAVDRVIELNANEPDYLLVSADADTDKQVVDLTADGSSQPTNVDAEGDEIMTNGSAVALPPGKSLPSLEKPPPVPPRNKPAPISTSRESEESLRAQKLYFGAQQDVTEVIGNVMFRLQCAIKPTGIDPKFGEQIDGIRETFYGSNAVYLKKGETYDVKIEDWANTIVFPSPSGPRSIYEALDVVFDEQVVEIDNKLTTQYASISKLPPIFQTQIQRTAFDPKIQQASKNQNPIVFEETIYLDRYMDSDKVMQRRREAWKWKSRIRKLEAREKVLKDAQGLPVTDAMDALKDYLGVLQEQEIEGIDVPSSVLEALEARRTELLHELDAISSEVSTLKQKLQDQFTDMREHRYRLQAVFIHRGTSTYGHYWIYIYDFERDIWREYNDERVSVVNDRKQIFEQSGNNGPTPYYLVYVRDQDKDDLVDAVCREIVEADEEEKDQPGGVPMDGDKDKAEQLLNGVQLLDDVKLIDTGTQTLPAMHNLNEFVGMGAWDSPQPGNDRETW
jgi:ubiquitin carboxyl-terminal hydrolase 25